MLLLSSTPYDLALRLAKFQRGACYREKGTLALGYMLI
jgi:hypothetical protein